MLCNISQNAMGQQGGYPARSSWGGYPGWGVPWPGGYPGRGGTLAGGVPWPGGYPGQGGTQLGQHREYLLHGGRYASCVHTGGLSFFVMHWHRPISKKVAHYKKTCTRNSQTGTRNKNNVFCRPRQLETDTAKNHPVQKTQ